MKEKMRILVFGLSANHGGVESVILNFCRAALDKGLSAFDFIVFDQIPDYARDLEQKGCRFFIVPNRMRDYFGYKRKLRETLRQDQYDYVWYNACTLSDVTLLKIASEENIKTILHAHNAENMGNCLNGVLHDRHKKSIELCTSVFVSCSEEASCFIFPNQVNEKKSWYLIKNALPLHELRFSPESRSRLREKFGLADLRVIGHVGRLHSQKNHKKILSVFEQFYREDHNARLVLIGSGPLEEQIKQEVEQRGLSDAVLFLGSIENVADWLSVFDVFLFPSLYEGLPVALLEAQANGLPCIISDTISPKAICSDNVSVLGLSEGDNAWSEAIQIAYEHADLRAREDAWHNVARAGYDIESETEKFIEMLSSQR